MLLGAIQEFLQTKVACSEKVLLTQNSRRSHKSGVCKYVMLFNLESRLRERVCPYKDLYSCVALQAIQCKHVISFLITLDNCLPSVQL